MCKQRAQSENCRAVKAPFYAHLATFVAAEGREEETNSFFVYMQTFLPQRNYHELNTADNDYGKFFVVVVGLATISFC